MGTIVKSTSYPALPADWSCRVCGGTADVFNGHVYPVISWPDGPAHEECHRLTEAS